MIKVLIDIQKFCESWAQEMDTFHLAMLATGLGEQTFLFTRQALSIKWVTTF